MGIDCQIGFMDPVNQTELDALCAKFSTDFPGPWPMIDDERGHVHAMSRFYEPGYERGHWPDIAKVLKWMLDNAPPDVRVGYCMDITDFDHAMEFTYGHLSAYWEHWNAHANEPYQEWCRKFDEKSK